MVDITKVVKKTYGDNGTIIELRPGDEKRLIFPRYKNWQYQIAIEAEYRNKDGRIFHFGSPFGVGRSDYCFSRALPDFDYKLQVNEAIEHGYQRCAGGTEDRSLGDSGKYKKSAWRNWHLVGNRPIKIFLILWRNLTLSDRLAKRIMKMRDSGVMGLGERYTAEPIVFHEKKELKEVKVGTIVEYGGKKYKVAYVKHKGRKGYNILKPVAATTKNIKRIK